MGRMVCAIRELKSRAGFILLPLVPANESMSPHTSPPIKNGPKPLAKPVDKLAREKTQLATKTSTNVGIISLTRFVILLGIAGWLQKQLSLRTGSGVSAQCGRK